jgi:hypothetical protein
MTGSSSLGATTTRLSVFPLPGALLFPGMHLPLHIFEPRYRAMVSDAMARDRRIGMIQPRPGTGEPPALFDLGCVGKIVEVEAMDDGRYNLILEGMALFRVARELQVATAFRQVEAELLPVGEPETLSLGHRASLESESSPLCRRARLCGGLGSGRPVGRPEPGQRHRADRAVRRGRQAGAAGGAGPWQPGELIVQLLQFFGRHGGDNRVTLQ